MPWTALWSIAGVAAAGAALAQIEYRPPLGAEETPDGVQVTIVPGPAPAPPRATPPPPPSPQPRTSPAQAAPASPARPGASPSRLQTPSEAPAPTEPPLPTPGGSGEELVPIVEVEAEPPPVPEETAEPFLTAPPEGGVLPIEREGTARPPAIEAPQEIIPVPSTIQEPPPAPEPPPADQGELNQRIQTQAIELARAGASRERIEALLRRLGPVSILFKDAMVADVVRFLAEACGIQYVGLPEGDERKVSLSFNDNPWKSLGMVARVFGFSLICEDGIWVFRPNNDTELLAREYHLRYSSQDEVEGGGSSSSSSYSGPAGSGSSSVSSSPGSRGNDTAGSSGGTGTGSRSTAGSISTPNKAFRIGSKKLLDDIKLLLGVQGFSGDSGKEDYSKPLGVVPAVLAPDILETPSDEKPKPGELGGSQVIYNADHNSLFIVGTRKQHELVKGYLRAFDKPQPLIAVEVKFFETQRDPRKQLGLDWSGTFDEGYEVTLGNLTTTYDLNRLLDWRAPDSAIMSGAQASMRVKFFANDRETTSVSYPRQVTINNREAVIRSVIEQPVLASETSTSADGNAQESASIEYLPIGTTINVLPKILDGNHVQMQILINVKNIVGEEVIGGNSYPVTSSRDYVGQAIVTSGYTLAVGGLEELFDTRAWAKFPWLGDLPFFGFLFKSRDHTRTKKNLIMFITPTILPSYSGGLPKEPISTIPLAGEQPVRPRYQGQQVNTLRDLLAFMRGMDREVELYEQLVAENRAERAHYDEMQDLKAEIDGLLRAFDYVASKRTLTSEEGASRQLLLHYAGRIQKSGHAMSGRVL